VSDGGSPTGVYYRRNDYMGVARRLLIDVIDIPVAMALSALVVFAAKALTGGRGISLEAALLLIGAVWFAYFVILKRSTIRTLGYIVFGARIVNLKGGQPTVLSLLARLCFAFIGPLKAVVDLFWLTGDPNRQAIRDKFAGTYVIRLNATPAGTGAIRLRTYMLWGMTFMFNEVRGDAP